jgi:hypothetical protein
MRESYFARGFKALSDNRDWSEAAWGNRHYLEPLLCPDVPMTSMARLLLAMGLAVKEAGESGLAADVTIQAVQDGRLDGPSLGDAMSQLLATGAINTTRWATRLGEVARVSDMHTLAARDAVEGALKGLPTETPRDLPALLTLLYELCVQTRRGVQSETARRALASIKVGGMTGKRAGQILSLP